MGHAGHGITADGTIVPFTVPEDVVRITDDGARARLEEVVSPGPARTAPACRHFGICGGCSIQMMQHESCLAWKRGLVVTALNQRGFANPPVEEIVGIPAGTRRRAIFKARKLANGVVAGFYEAESHRLVNITECPVLVPELAALLARMKIALEGILRDGEKADLHATVSDTGVDLSLKLERRRNPELLMQLSRLAGDLKLARLCWNGEPVVVVRPPCLRIGEYSVALPAECFLQSSKEGEHVLQQLAVAALGKPNRVADLFSGCGTFSFALAAQNVPHVDAFDSSIGQIEALKAAARQTGGKVRAEVRDLFRRPLSPEELQNYDAILLNPPRPGAIAQVRNLARSRVASLIYVSCSSASFARDARILCDGGYRLDRVVPIDQFVWSPHVELFAHFTR